MTPKRRLPLLNARDESQEPPRPPWQWVCFGAVAIFATWVPLSAFVGAVTARLVAHASDETAERRFALVATAGYAIELAAGSVAGGYLVGKWGPPGVGMREAVLAGFIAAALAAAMTFASAGFSEGLLLLAAIAPIAAAAGARLGLRGRPR